MFDNIHSLKQGVVSMTWTQVCILYGICVLLSTVPVIIDALQRKIAHLARRHLLDG